MLWGMLIPAWLKRAAVALAGGLAVIMGAFLAGKREGRRDAKIADTEADNAAHKRMDKADVSNGSADDDREWLRKRSGK